MANVNIGILLIMFLGGAAGLLSTLYLLLSLPAVLIWKIYRRVTQKIPMMK